MIDREKVIRGLECMTDLNPCRLNADCRKSGCVYAGTDCELRLMQDALTLLREHEPKKRESLAMLPCKCGCKRRRHSCGWINGRKIVGLRCHQCGLTVIGKNETDVIRNWNKTMLEVSGNDP